MTGALDIQNFLLLNQAELKVHGYEYPEHTIDSTKLIASGNDHDLMQTYSEKGEDAAIEAKEQFFNKNSANSLLLSSDNFFRFPGEVHRLFPEAKIIICLGPQYERLVLNYIQKVRYSNLQETFSAELEKFYKNKNQHFYHIYLLLEKWFALYPANNIILQPVCEEAFLDKKVYYDFLSNLGIIEHSQFNVPDIFSYIPYCRDALEYKRLFNQLCEGDIKSSENAVIDQALIKYSKEYYTKGGRIYSLVTKEEQEKINALYAEKNSLLAKEILHRPDGRMFPSVTHIGKVYGGLSPDKVLELTEYILSNTEEEGLETLYMEMLEKARKSNTLTVKKALKEFSILLLVIDQRFGGDNTDSLEDVDSKTIKVIEKAKILFEDKRHKECIDFIRERLDKYGSHYSICHYYLQSLFETTAEGEELEVMAKIQRESHRLGDIRPIAVYVELLKNIRMFKRTIDALIERMYESAFIDLERLMLYTSWIEYDCSEIVNQMQVKYNHLREFDPDRLKGIDAAGIYFFGEQKKTRQKTLIVSGNPRSGTTALGDVLNFSDDIGLFLERYNYTLGYHPNMFQEEYLFAPRFTGTELSKQNEDLRSKVGRSKYIGDKIPRFFVSWPITAQNYDPEDIKIVHISRNIYDVAYSYEQRAKWSREGLDTGWLGNRDTYAACKEANIANLRTLEALNDPKFKDSIYVVEYETIYTSINHFKELFEYLEVDWTETLESKLETFLEKSKKLENKDRIISEDDHRIIEEVYDFELHNEIVKRARS